MRFLLIAVACAALVSGCATAVPGEPIATGSSRASTKPLPFTPTIKNRTNDRNDGTTFEPCTAYTDADLLPLDINPGSIRDAAQVDAANYRGCRWNANDYTARSGGGQYSQIVGLTMTLEQYKRSMKTLRWQPDRQAHGRTIAYAPENNYCSASFSSERAIVVTIASSTNPSPGNQAECERAIAFASLAASKAP
ncbi:hypothetical protein TPAU25S_00044 [Tsukamurella paurometabola]|uniref:DUF3558 domain-containing protein n=1 Tax=Tsukamurella paurometabola (strain ATCC 8368 / DSM 20162 / CCUG 35730 / CIP 100753 / JCM 10117 / KCTC 9821 / NBRC 16120 / NCIMB 702349 / NCTC 13040) TaxID=521096 RepID=D5UWR8_TSUPD|nr:DUF3558 domain-containing protein [Tsukamurella paurometabola]ADG77940.1 conserved hypothetical protein [Tsukamurella paurometabola DSM 20162]SUP29450.1 Protein of uncharacterised function (DUF3558) [Tsukamurella paurometabola]